MSRRAADDAELERIRSAYAVRDAAVDHPYRWDNPGYVGYMQFLERALLRAFADVALPLAGAGVLHVGCGSGYFLHRLREYGAGDVMASTSWRPASTLDVNGTRR